MPLRVIDDLERNIHSFELSDSEWQELVRANRASHNLRMPCCHAPVIAKTSRRGTRFFAHKSAAKCATAPESEEHLHLKIMVVQAARANGWSAETEVAGISPDGHEWRADVLAERGPYKVAIEIQWSGQSTAEMEERQERYKRSGVRGLWLLRRPGFPICRELPCACIGGNIEDGFVALLPHSECMSARDRKDAEAWRQSLPMGLFLDAVFQRRFRFGIPQKFLSTVLIRSAWMECWGAGCQTKTRIISSISIEVGPEEFILDLRSIGRFPDVLAFLLCYIPKDDAMSVIKSRYSHTMEGSYVSNGCRRCDRLFGQFYTRSDPEDEVLARIDKMPLSAPWRLLIIEQEGEDAFDYWSVFAPHEIPFLTVIDDP